MLSESTRRTSFANKRRPQTAALSSQNTGKKVPQINNNNNNRIKMNMNKTSLTGKTKLAGLKIVQTQIRMANTLLGKANPISKPALEEFEKEMVDPSQVAIKEMVEQASVEQRAISMIEDTLYLFNNNGEGKGAGIEKYELINKEEFENMKN